MERLRSRTLDSSGEFDQRLSLFANPEPPVFPRTILIGLSLVLNPALAPAETLPHYALAETLVLPGPVRWDYLTLDIKNHRLFITRGERVDVFDTSRKSVIGTIDHLEGVHGVALVPEQNKIFITEGTANRVAIVDFQTLAPVTTVATGLKPDAVTYDPASERVFVSDNNGESLTIIDTKSLASVGQIKLDGAPETSVADGDGRLYVNLEDKSQIAVIDTKNQKLLSRFDLTSACEEPTGLAFNPKEKLLFSVCRNKHMLVVDAVTGSIKEILPIDGRPDAAIFDAEHGLVFSSNGEGTLTVVGKTNEAHYEVLETVPTKTSARTMALDPETGDIFLSAAEMETLPASTDAERRPSPIPGTFTLLRVSPTKH